MVRILIEQRSLWNVGAGGPVKFRERLERLGPTFVKFGQFLALRPDLIPDEYALELMRLFDEAPPFPWSEARRILREDLSQAALDSFAYIEPVPIGAASLAQVHAARLQSGEDVAIKIQRPGLRDKVLHDLSRARRLIRWLRLSQVTYGFDVDDVLRELTAWMLSEIDFDRELQNLTRLREEAGAGRCERFPRPYPELSASRVLTTELLRGVRVSTLLSSIRTGGEQARARWTASGINLDRFARSLLHSTLRQIFASRFFHADLHPGNLMVMPGNAVGFVDFGLCDELDERVRREQMRYFIAVYDNDIEGMYRTLAELLIPGTQTDAEAFRQDFYQLMADWDSNATRSAQDASGERSPIGKAIAGVMRAVRRHGYRIPPRMLSMYRSLLGAETIAYQLGSSATLGTVGRKFFRGLQQQEVRRSFDRENVERHLLDVHQLVTRSPRQIQQLLSDLAEGRFYLNVNTAERTRSAIIRNRRTRLLSTAILSVGLSLLAASPHPFPAFDTIIRGLLLAAVVATYGWIFAQWRRLE